MVNENSALNETQEDEQIIRNRKAEKTEEEGNQSQESIASNAAGKTKKRKFIHVAPLNTPMKQRLETIGIIWHTISIPTFVCLFLIMLSLGVVSWVFVILPYFIWWYGFDLHTPTNGKVVYRTREWLKNIIVWEWFVDYFPIRAHKTCELEPTFQIVKVESSHIPDDEEDLISEHSRTIIDKLFKTVGLRKRLNGVDSYSPPPINNADTTSQVDKKVKYEKIATGPRYIFGYHPHGVISMGAMGLFATNALRNEPFEPPLRLLKPLFHDPSKGKQLFPGIGNIFPLTLTTQFTLPFYRDYLLSLGLTSASAKNIKSLISNGDNSVCIVVGGAQESLLNNMVAPKSKVGHGFKGGFDHNEEGLQDGQIRNKSESKREIKLVLHKRKGFVKLAIELGNVSLVPTFAFGEADIYKLSIPKPGSFGYYFQHWIKSKFSFTIPFFSARGVFIYDFGFLPYRNPINICTGRPIYIPENALAEYKRNHPESDDNSPSDQSQQSDKQSSLSDTSKSKGKNHSSVKTKMPSGLLDHYHKLYAEELKRVFDENKHKFGYDDVELNFVE